MTESRITEKWFKYRPLFTDGQLLPYEYIQGGSQEEIKDLLDRHIADVYHYPEDVLGHECEAVDLPPVLWLNREVTRDEGVVEHIKKRVQFYRTLIDQQTT